MGDYSELAARLRVMADDMLEGTAWDHEVVDLRAAADALAAIDAAVDSADPLTVARVLDDVAERWEGIVNACTTAANVLRAVVGDAPAPAECPTCRSPSPGYVALPSQCFVERDPWHDAPAPRPRPSGRTRTMSDETDGQFLARVGTDGAAWAREFVARFGGNEDLLFSWFANAIEVGRTAGQATVIDPADRYDHNEAMARREAVFQSLGEASMCWDPIPTGVFDSEHAKSIGERLCAVLNLPVEADRG